MKYFVTGGAGFIGSNFVDKLLENDCEVIAYDNLSTGQLKYLEKASLNKNFTFIKGDLLNKKKLNQTIKNSNFVIHLAANADIRYGLNNPYRDLEQNTIATFNLLEAMRNNKIKKIAFSSTGSVYGECDIIPTPENAPFPIQTSLYASSKLACESLIQSYCEGYGFKSWIFRFVSILGKRYSHGHIYDFYKQLSNDKDILNVLGNGKQKKSYLHIDDCISGVLCGIEKSNEKVNIFNLGTDEFCEVNDSISIITNFMNITPQLKYSGGERGWVGDNPMIYLDINRILKVGWKPKYSIKSGIIETLKYLDKNKWLIQSRD